MDELIVRFLQGVTTPREEERLRAWRRSSGENERRYRELAAIWRATSPGPARSGETPPAAAEIAAAADHPGGGSWLARVPTRRAVPVAVALVAGLLIGQLWPDQAPPAALRAAEFVTGPHELATARLSDGTVVRLAPSARLRVEERPDRREVWLDGKAFFAVRSDGRTTFTVRTRAGEALVLGTRFEVDVATEGVRVLVIEGKVEVGAGPHRVEVGAGEMASASEGAPPRLSEPEDIRSILTWMGSFLAFENTPLRQVAVEIEDRYGVRVEIADSALAERAVTAWFGDEDPETVLKVICRIADAYCSIGDGFASIEP